MIRRPRLRLLPALLITASACTKSPSPAGSTSAVTTSSALRASPEVPPTRTPPEPEATVTSPPPIVVAAPSSEPKAPSPGGKVTNNAPLSIQFHAREMSTLHNGSDRAFFILHDNYLQPSRLEVTPSNGTPAAAFDTRSVKKFDATIRKEKFRRVEPNSDLPLFALRVTPQEGGFELRWGPFRIGPLPAGTYSASVVWEAREAQYFDDASGKNVKLEGAFVGTVRSPPIPLQLPLP